MKKLKGRGLGRIKDLEGSFECDEIILELDHGRTIRLRRETVAGEDGIVFYMRVLNDRIEQPMPDSSSGCRILAKHT